MSSFPSISLPWRRRSSSVEDVQRIDEIIADVLKTFERGFPPCYKNALLDSMADRKRIGPPNTYLLSQAPTSARVLKRGTMVKRGERMKSWKRRWFAALNEADNFDITYGKNENGSNVIGRFSCCGYRVEPFTADESAVHGENGIKLVPHDDSRRCWWFLADSTEEQEAWMAIFASACRKAKPASDSDPIIRDAFKHTYQLIRTTYGFYGSCYFYGNEIDMLEDLLKQMLSREIIDELVATINNDGNDGSVPQNNLSPSARANETRQLVAMVDTKTKQAVKTSWNNLRNDMLTQYHKYVASITPHVEELQEMENSIQQLLYNPVLQVVESAYGDLHFRILAPVADICGNHIMDAYEMALRSFFSDMTKRITVIMCNPTSLTTEIQNLLDQVDYNSTVASAENDEDINKSSLLMSSKSILMMMSSVHLQPIEDNFVGSITAFEIYCRCIDDLRSLLQNAIHSFGHTLKTQGVTNRILSIFNENILKLCTDMTTKLRDSLYNILVELSESNIQDSMIIPCADVFRAIRKQANIPAHLKELTYVNYIGERLIKDLVYKNIVKLVELTYESSAERLHTVVTQLCDTLPASA